MTGEAISPKQLSTLLGDWREGVARGGISNALSDRIRLLTIDGRLPSGTRLPSERVFAEQLGLSRTTLAHAYRRLREAGCARSRVGSGTVVMLPTSGLTTVYPADSENIDFSKAAFPAVPWLADTALEVVSNLGPWTRSDGYDPRGLPELRNAIARRYEERGMPTRADQILVTHGAQHAIALLARTLISRGERAVLEAPTYPHIYEALRDSGARLMPVPVDFSSDGDGQNEGVEEAAELERVFLSIRPSLAILGADFQNPTSRSFGPPARDRITRAALRAGVTLIIDETTAELDIDRGYRTLPFRSAVLIGSANKSIWGGLRLGWIRAESELIRRLQQARLLNDLGNPVIDQLILHRLLRKMDETLELRRHQLSAARDALMQEVAALLPTWSIPCPRGGIAAWVGLGAPVSSRLAIAARSRGLTISAGPRFATDGAFERHLRLPLCTTADQMRRAVGILASVWKELPDLDVNRNLDPPPVF